MSVRTRVRFCLALGLVVIAIVAIALLWAHDRYTRPGPLSETKRLVIEPGSSLSRIGDALFRAGIVDQPLILRLGVRFDGMQGRLRAGEYDFPPRLSMREAGRLIASGRVVRRKLTIAEGLNIPQVVSLVLAAEGLVGALPTPPFEEGSILPETYFYSRGDRRDALIARMQKAMLVKLSKLWDMRAPGLLLRSPRDAVVLASLIEKETGKEGERARISAVFHNRLRRGMRLQSDPTVVYAIGRGADKKRRPLSRADLEFASPYNTYLNAGLPPGPIASPGEAAIRAALSPTKSRELYFVADGSGGHLFARTLAQHNRNVARWRRLQRKLRDNR